MTLEPEGPLIEAARQRPLPAILGLGGLAFWIATWFPPVRAVVGEDLSGLAGVVAPPIVVAAAWLVRGWRPAAVVAWSLPIGGMLAFAYLAAPSPLAEVLFLTAVLFLVSFALSGLAVSGWAALMFRLLASREVREFDAALREGEAAVRSSPGIAASDEPREPSGLQVEQLRAKILTLSAPSARWERARVILMSHLEAYFADVASTRHASFVSHWAEAWAEFDRVRIEARLESVKSG